MSDFNGNKSSSSIFTRSYTVHSTSTDYAVKPYLPYSSIQRSDSVKKSSNFDSIKGKVRKLRSLFESPKPSSDESLSQFQVQPKTKSEKPFSSYSDYNFKVSPSPQDSSPIRLPGTENRVVVYFTSLRGIRRTYEDCYAVRMILRLFRVLVDERDISMDSAYKKELQNVLGGGKQGVSLPQVFIKGKYVGGADAIKQLHETGELAKILKGLPIRAPGYVCQSCGDVRFVPCSNCNGSRKVFDEDEDQLKRCPECNENGLVRCSACCF